MFSITTMASSTHQSGRQGNAKRVSVLTGNPTACRKQKFRISDTGIVTAGMMVLGASLEKYKMTRMTRTMASIQGGKHVPDRSPTASG
jgi:hypothetical protein